MAETTQRIYTVKNKKDGAITLVKAATQAQAIRFVSGGMFDIEVTSAVELADLMIAGNTVHFAKPEGSAE